MDKLKGSQENITLAGASFKTAGDDRAKGVTDQLIRSVDLAPERS